MNRLIMHLLVIFLASFIFLTSCRPPAVEGTVLKIKNEEYDDALVSAEAAVKDNPLNAEAWYYYGWLNGKQAQNWGKMNEGFDKALDLNSQQKVRYSGNNISIQDAVSAVRSTMFTENYNSAIQLVKDSRETEDSAVKTTKLEKARDKFIVSSLVSPERTETYQPLAVTYLSLGDTAKALSTLEEGLIKLPGDENLRIAAGEVYSMSGKNDEAIAHYNKALEINPDNSLVYQKLGVIESNRKSWDKANQYYQKAMELDPDNADLTYNIGVGYYNQEKVVDAIPYFEKSVELEPGNEITYTILASCYNREKMYNEAIEFLKEALQIYPEKAELWSYLAVAYANKGMAKEAKDAEKKLKELKGD